MAARALLAVLAVLGGTLLAVPILAADVDPPRVASTLPPDGATNVTVTADIVIAFNEEMNTTSASDAFSVAPSAEGVILWAPNGTRLTFSPTLDLAYATLYTVTEAGTAKDLAGNFLDGDGNGTGGDAYVFSFTTETDTTAPHVDSTSPTDGAMGVSISANVFVRFSETMDRPSVEAAFRVTHGTTTWTGSNGSFRWSGVSSWDDTVGFNPFENWPFGQVVTVTLNASVARDPAGFYLDGDMDGSSEGSPADDVTWSFTTETTDATPPMVIAVDPANGAAQVLETTGITLLFSEAMNRTSVENAFSLASAPRTWTKMDGTLAWSPGRDQATYTPSANLAFGTAYTIRLAAGAVDVNGNALDGDGNGVGGDDFLSSFTTRFEPDAVPPTVLSTTPIDGSMNVPRTPVMSITFDDAMNRAATEEAISMERLAYSTSTPVALGPFEWSASDTTVSFPSSAALSWDSVYRIFVSQAAKDDAGLRIPTPYSFTFRTTKWSGRVFGSVFDGERPVSGATVTLGNSTTQTNATGAFEFDGVDAGTYEITASKVGYETARLTRTLDYRIATGDEGRVIDLGTISLRRSDLVSPVVAVGIVTAVVAALLTLGFLLRRRRRSIVRFDDLEPEEADVER